MIKIKNGKVTFEYFTLDEFDSPDEPGSGKKMVAYFIHLLDKAREHAGIPFKITSGYRTEEHNKKVGGSPNSNHMYGLAADIECKDLLSAIKIINSLGRAGIYNIGYYPKKKFIHADLGTSMAARYWVED